MSIKFVNEKEVSNGITTTTNIVLSYGVIYDDYYNDIATDLTECDRCVSSVCKQYEGSKYSVYVNGDDVPVSMEHDDYGEVGGLWFEKKKLVDYDGCGSLPKDIIKVVRKLGFTVPRHFTD
jgi:hypothetical protein